MEYKTWVLLGLFNLRFRSLLKSVRMLDISVKNRFLTPCCIISFLGILVLAWCNGALLHRVQNLMVYKSGLQRYIVRGFDENQKIINLYQACPILEKEFKDSFKYVVVIPPMVCQACVLSLFESLKANSLGESVRIVSLVEDDYIRREALAFGFKKYGHFRISEFYDITLSDIVLLKKNHGFNVSMMHYNENDNSILQMFLVEDE